MSKDKPGYYALVHDILDMFTCIQHGWAKAKDKDGIKEEWVTFPGFDGNSQTEMMVYAQELRAAGRWKDLKVRNESLNSHRSASERLPEMVDRWNAVSNKKELSIQDIRRILDR